VVTAPQRIREKKSIVQLCSVSKPYIWITMVTFPFQTSLPFVADREKKKKKRKIEKSQAHFAYKEVMAFNNLWCIIP
jgi:hypothetical protein